MRGWGSWMWSTSERAGRLVRKGGSGWLMVDGSHLADEVGQMAKLPGAAGDRQPFMVDGSKLTELCDGQPSTINH